MVYVVSALNVIYKSNYQNVISSYEKPMYIQDGIMGSRLCRTCMELQGLFTRIHRELSALQNCRETGKLVHTKTLYLKVAGM